MRDADLKVLERIDRPRWLVECYRARRPILYKLGDEVSPALPGNQRYPGRWRVVGAEGVTEEFGFRLEARFILRSVDWGTYIQWAVVVPYGC